MGIVREEVFVDQLCNVPNVRAATQWVLSSMGPRLEGQSYPHCRNLARPAYRVNREDALAIYGLIRSHIRDVGHIGGKYLRPWDLDRDLYRRLDRTKAWWGFEFETGYRTQEMRGEVIDHVWDTWDNVAFDSEGEAYAVEITFAPQEMDKYLDGTADAFKFVEYLDGNPRVANEGGEAVGTHINLSHPEINRDNVNRVAYCLARSVAALSITKDGVNTRHHMFGRERLYGGFFPQNTQTATWIEGKLFRTAYDVETFKRYIKVCEGLTKCAELFARAADSNRYVDNLYAVCFEGAEPNVVAEQYRGEIDGTRGNNLLNGAMAPDYAGQVLHLDEDEEEYEDDHEDGNGLVWCDDCEDFH